MRKIAARAMKRILHMTSTQGRSIRIAQKPYAREFLLGRFLRDFPWARVRRGEVDVVLKRGGLPPARLAVADPPRAGLDRDVIDYLSGPEAGTERFCYVSCDPATLARDIGLLQARGWQLEGLRAFDAFPMTHHVECVATLSRPA